MRVRGASTGRGKSNLWLDRTHRRSKALNRTRGMHCLSSFKGRVKLMILLLISSSPFFPISYPLFLLLCSSTNPRPSIHQTTLLQSKPSRLLQNKPDWSNFSSRRAPYNSPLAPTKDQSRNLHQFTSSTRRAQ